MTPITHLLHSAPIRYGAAISWTLYFTMLLLQPADQLPVASLLPQGDAAMLLREVIFSVGHLVAFFILAFLWFHALRPQQWRSLWQIAALLLVYALCTEFAQTLTPGRAAQWNDLAGNLGGILLAMRVYASRFEIPMSRITPQR